MANSLNIYYFLYKDKTTIENHSNNNKIFVLEICKYKYDRVFDIEYSFAKIYP